MRVSQPRARAFNWSIPSQPWRSWNGKTSLQALPPVCARRAPYRAAGYEALAPFAAIELPGAPACDSQAVVLGERFQKAFEVVLIHRDVRVDVDEDVGLDGQRREPCVECADDRRSALALPFLGESHDTDPFGFFGEPRRHLRRRVRRPVLDDEPLGRNA